MKKIKFSSMMMLALMVLPFMASCSDDDSNGGGSDNISVMINENGTTSNGSIFSAIDDKNFYLDYIKYTVEEGHLVVTGYDKVGFKGVANIVTRIVYKGNAYEVLEIGRYAFERYNGLTIITIPKSVTTI